MDDRKYDLVVGGGGRPKGSVQVEEVHIEISRALTDLPDVALDSLCASPEALQQAFTPPSSTAADESVSLAVRRAGAFLERCAVLTRPAACSTCGSRAIFLPPCGRNGACWVCPQSKRKRGTHAHGPASLPNVLSSLRHSSWLPSLHFVVYMKNGTG